MPTLLIRLCGPMQSWGTQSRFSERDTGREPSKSGVVGLLCAALGWPRDRDVSRLAHLRMGVRVDAEGRMARDYQTAGAGGPEKGGGIRRASGGISSDAVLSSRYYLQDADFLVGLEDEDEALLRSLEAALLAPRWQLFLGRKAFVPGVPPALPGGGIRQLALEDALRAEPWPLQPVVWRHQPAEDRRLRLILETTPGDPDAETRLDQPIGAAFVSSARKFGPRAIRQSFFEKEPMGVPQPTHA